MLTLSCKSEEEAPLTSAGEPSGPPWACSECELGLAGMEASLLAVGEIVVDKDKIVISFS